MGDDDERQKALDALYSELSKQKAIFEENKHRTIEPDGSEAYWEAKAKFDAAGSKIIEIESEIAIIQSEMEPDYNAILR